MNDKIDILKESFSIIVTKFPQDEEKEDLVEKLESVLKSPMIGQKAKYLLEIGLKKLFIFRKPARNTSVENLTLLDEVVTGMEFLNMTQNRDNFRFVLEED